MVVAVSARQRMTTQTHLSQEATDALRRWPLPDNAIVQHGFAPYLRDYQVIVETPAIASDQSRSDVERRYQFLFTHCVVANVASAIRDDVWRTSWNDAFIEYAEWQARGSPAGYVWGVRYANAYPGARIVADSPIAAEWAARLSQPMAEVRIETNVQSIQLVFHELRVHEIARGDRPPTSPP